MRNVVISLPWLGINRVKWWFLGIHYFQYLGIFGYSVISCLHRCTLCYEWLPRQTSLIMSNCSNLPSNVQHIWPPWYGSRSHRPTFSGVGHLYIPSTMSLYQNNQNLTLSMPQKGKEMAECTQLCAILLISNLRNLQYLASLSIPMPQFEVFATSMYLAPWLNTQKSSLDPVDA